MYPIHKKAQITQLKGQFGSTMTQQESGTDENHNRYKSSKKVNQESVSRPLVDALNHGKGSDHKNMARRIHNIKIHNRHTSPVRKVESGGQGHLVHAGMVTREWVQSILYRLYYLPHSGPESSGPAKSKEFPTKQVQPIQTRCGQNEQDSAKPRN